LRGETLKKILKVISREFDVNLDKWRDANPVEVLISTILSQRTSDRNVEKAMKLFRERFRELSEVASAKIIDIEKVIKPAGIYKMKARRIKEIAETLLKSPEILDEILRLPYEKAREKLLELPGVGVKTADVFLMAVRGAPVIPIDTHIFRIMRRIGVAEHKENYDSLKKKLEDAVSPEDRMRIHLALIEFGRKICKAQKPRCGVCPISEYCQYYKHRNRGK